MRAVRRASRGVTIVEVMITVGIVALLTAITIPVLRSVSMRTHDAKNQTSLRSTHQHFRLYANDNDDYFVNAGRPIREGYPTTVDFGEGNAFTVMSYYGQVFWWPLVAGSYFQEAFPTWHSTHVRELPAPRRGIRTWTNPQYAVETEFLYSNTMLADPRQFSDDAVHDDWRLMKKVRWSEVAYASAKGMMFDNARPQEGAVEILKNVVFSDGSVELIDFATAVDAPPGASWNGTPVLSTPLGVLGRDFAR